MLYELPLSSLSALFRTYLEDIPIVLGSDLAVLVRSPTSRFDSNMVDLVSPLNDDRDDDCLTSSVLNLSNLLLQSVHGELKPGLNLCHIQYLRLQGQYHLILPPNGMQDRFLGHIWFFQMGPILEFLPNTPNRQVQLKAQDRRIFPGALVYFLLEVRLYIWWGGERPKEAARRMVLRGEERQQGDTAGFLL